MNMSPTMEVPELSALPTTHLRCLEFLEEVVGFTCKTVYQADAEAYLADAARQLREHRFCLAFVGHWSSGKSSLINRLVFGVDEAAAVLPVEDKPTTARLTWLQHGAEPRLQRAAQGVATVVAEGAADVRARLMELATSVPKEADEEFELIVDWPAEILAHGLVIVDTPGLQDPNKLRSITTEQNMARFHSIVVVSPIATPLSESLLAFLSPNIFRNQLRKFFFLLNKSDRLQAGGTPLVARLDFAHQHIDREVGAMRERFRGELGQRPMDLVPRERFFAVSAHTGEGLRPFTESLSEFLRTDKYGEMLKWASNRAHEFFARCDARIVAEEKAAASKRSDFSGEIKRVEGLSTRMVEEIQHLHNVLKDEFRHVEADTKQRIRDAFDKQERAGTEFLKNISDGWMPGAIAKAINDFAERSERELEIDLEAAQARLRTDLEFAVKKHETKIVTALEELNDAVNDLRTQVSGEVPDFSKSGLLSTGDAAGVGVGTVAAGAVGYVAWTASAVTTAWTTSTLVSTAPTWVPFAVAKFLGMTTTVTTVHTAVAVGSLVVWLAIPAFSVAAVATAFLFWHKRRASRKNFEEHLSGLPLRASDICKQLEKRTSEALSSVVNSLRSQTEVKVRAHQTEICSYEEAAQKCAPSESCQKLKERLPCWVKKLTVLAATSA